MNYLDIHVPNTIVEVFETDQYLFLDAIIVNDNSRGKGLGQQALEKVIHIARSKGKTLYGYATDLLGGDIHKLYKWYQSAGFKIEHGVLHNEFDYNIVLK